MKRVCPQLDPPSNDSRRRQGRRSVGALAAVLALLFGAIVAVASPASAAGTGRILASPCLNFRADAVVPGYNSMVGCIPYNASIMIDCVKNGVGVSGPYGYTTLWDHTSWGGVSGFVTDAYVYTGTSNAVAGPCGSAPPPVASRQQRAVNWLNARRGSTAYNYLCELLVENAYGTRGRYSSALSDFYAQRAAGRVHYDVHPPAGALVFTRGSIPSLGHVMISNGNGQYWTSDGSVHLVSTITYGGTYYGWSYAPTAWPGA